MGLLLMASGLLLTGIGTWSGYRNAHDAIAPVVDGGDPTRSAIDAARPLVERSVVRRIARSVAVAIGWLGLALYGLFLVSAGSLAGTPA